MQQFEFTLPNEKKRSYNRFALLLIILSGLSVAINHLSGGIHPPFKGSVFFFISLLLLICQFLVIIGNDVHRFLILFIAGSLAISFYWYFYGPWWAGLLYLILTLLYVLAQRKLKVEIDQQQIIYPSFPKQIIRWDELNNLVLKDGLLTIDFKNDKIIQQYPDLKTNPVNEQEFNEFCQQQLHQNPESRIQNQ